jgi:hypothetical protein
VKNAGQIGAVIHRGVCLFCRLRLAASSAFARYGTPLAVGKGLPAQSIRPEVSPMVAVKTDLLDRPMDNLQRALARNDSSPVEWTRSVDLAAADLVRATREHINATESPNGALTTLESSKQQTVATLDRHVQEMRTEHMQLVDGAGELHSKLEGLLHRLHGPYPPQAVDSEIANLRQTGEGLLDRLREHREVEQKLLMDSINTDVGVGD